MALKSQLLSSFGNVIGRGPYFKAEADRHGCNLFVLNVGNSSKGRKGTSWGQIANLMSNVDSTWLGKKISAGIGSGEALVYMLRDSLDEVQLLDEDKRLMILETEFGSLLKVVNREGNLTSPVFRNVWDGTTLRNITKGLSLEATNHHVSMIGHITMTELSQLLRQTEVMNGLANRFLFFFVKRSGVKPFGGTPPDDDIRMMADEVKASVEFARHVSQMKRSRQADELWIEVYPNLSEGLPGIIGSLSSRSEAQVMRLAMILALFNRQDQITREALEAALAIHDYCLDSLKYVFGNKLGVRQADLLFDFICGSENGVTRTSVRDFFNKNCPKESIDDAVRMLVDAKLIEVYIQPSGGGRPAEVLRQVKGDKMQPLNRADDENDKSPLMSYKSYNSVDEVRR